MKNERVGCQREHLYLSSNCWDGLWIIQQPTATAISGDESVFYVERFVSVFTVLRYPSLWPRLFTWLKGARRVSSTLRLLAPLPLFHLGHRVPWLFRLEFALQRRWILWWARRTSRGMRVLWIDNPLYECAIGRMGEGLVVYHVADEISEFTSSHERITIELETETLGKVDVVFAASERLASQKRDRQPRSYGIWNAIDTEAFDFVPPEGSLDDVDQIPRPRVAFVGVIEDWVDLDVLASAAKELSSVSFVVVGFARVDSRMIRGIGNIHFLGRRNRLLVPDILRRCSASLIPFKKTKLTARVVPLKLFEALAAGITPVCTDFSTDLDRLVETGYVKVAANGAGFASAVRQAIAEDTPERRRWLSDYGRRQTWQARWHQMREIIEQLPVRATT